MVMYHIDSLQKRPDLPKHPSIDDLLALRDQKVQMTGDAGLDAGLSFVVSRDNIADLPALIEYVYSKKEISTLLVTHSLDTAWFSEKSRQIRRGKTSIEKLSSEDEFRRRTDNNEVAKILADAFRIEPFGYLPSRKVGGRIAMNLQWMNYFVPVAYANGSYKALRVTSGVGDQVLLRLFKKISGRNAFYVGQNRRLLLAQLLFNGLFNRNLIKTLAFLLDARRNKAIVLGKRFAFDNGHLFTADGDMACMEACPNPTVRNNKIVPVCIADHEEHAA
jgi:hypothetical protein